MKTLCASFLSALLALSLFSCTKKSSDAPAPAPVAKTAATPAQVTTRPFDTVRTGTFTPYTEVYTGSYTDVTWANYGPPLMFIGSMTDTAIVFYVYHPNDHQVIFSSHGNMWETGNISSYIHINDTFTYSPGGYYLGHMDPLRNSANKYWQVGVDTISQAGTLTLHWDYARPICADEEDHFCTFTGIKR